MEEALLTQRLTALKQERESLELEVSRQESVIRTLQNDKIVLQSDVNVLKAQRDRLVVQKKQLRVGAVCQNWAGQSGRGLKYARNLL